MKTINRELFRTTVLKAFNETFKKDYEVLYDAFPMGTITSKGSELKIPTEFEMFVKHDISLAGSCEGETLKGSIDSYGNFTFTIKNHPESNKIVSGSIL